MLEVKQAGANAEIISRFTFYWATENILNLSNLLSRIFGKSSRSGRTESKISLGGFKRRSKTQPEHLKAVESNRSACGSKFISMCSNLFMEPERLSKMFLVFGGTKK
jgi:hypothetical protein